MTVDETGTAQGDAGADEPGWDVDPDDESGAAMAATVGMPWSVAYLALLILRDMFGVIDVFDMCDMVELSGFTWALHAFA